MPDKNFENPFFVFIGNCDHEGLVSKIKASNWTYRKKSLDSRPTNWLSIADIINQEAPTGIIAKITWDNVRLMCRDEYKDASIELLNAIERKQNIIFMHESILSGQATESATRSYQEFDNERYFFGKRIYTPEDIKQRDLVLSMFEKRSIDIVPYQKNAHLTVVATSFIEQNEGNLIFRMYVPSDRIWSTETGRLLQLFRDYLGNISGLKFKQDQYSTNQGTIYEFFGDENTQNKSLYEEFEDFSSFLDNCINDPGAARGILAEKKLQIRSHQEIVERYAKEAKRIHIDIKHERERRILAIRQRMEEELIETPDSNLKWDELAEIVDRAIPQVRIMSSALTVGLNNTPLPQQKSPRMPGIEPNFLKATEIIAQELNGAKQARPETIEIMQIINQHGGNQTPQLVSSMHELTDPQVRAADRIMAQHRIKSFLYKFSDKIGEATFKLAQKYIEQKLGL